MNAVTEHADRLKLVETRTPSGLPRFTITWRNTRSADLHVAHLHPLVPGETAQAVLDTMKASPELLRILK
jgi:hypothetical protein